ncbi:L,D-transpeptidase [Calothrix sp. UHCC 0171]|uniref:L,D-transpeptidase n=1 Tax=Calothrix sp. UHCC 0171 TaxID=3110245 RepID=UPI002B211A93|nr:L,D-transpeptidase [Calothrix sp. UHCC 0171]MEA5573803.1 L,D-transpeptidase [Calothrix sp. UHCC 0171]
MNKKADSKYSHLPSLLFVAVIFSFSTLAANTQQVAAQPKGQLIQQQIQQLKQSKQRWIQVNLSKQRLIAWEGRNPVYTVLVSTGKKATPTLTGVFNVQTKLKKTRMQGEGYNIPNVPHVMYYDRGYGIHGAYWHRKFGTPVSRGCVNLAPNHAKWLYEWSRVGTPIIVQR